MGIRRFGIDIRPEHLARLVAKRLEQHNRMGLNLNEALYRVPRECGTPDKNKIKQQKLISANIS